MEEERDQVYLGSETVVVGCECEGCECEDYVYEDYVCEDCANEDCVNEASDYEDCGGDGHCCNNTDLPSGIRTESISSFCTLLSRFDSFHTYSRPNSTYYIRDLTPHNRMLHPHL